MGLKVGVLGSTGYTGAELVRLLINHPGVEISWLTSEKFSGKRISDVFPQFRKFLGVECVGIGQLGKLSKVDVAFSCLPNATSMHFVVKLLKTGARVIDLSADFRLKDVTTYKNWYKVKHSYEDLLKEAVYGLPEINREKIRDAKVIANPGCYSTTAILGVAPILPHRLIEQDSIVVDTKAGLSGAGRAPTLEHHFSEANESVSAYGVEGHSQKPEMDQELSNLADSPVNVTFIPHRVPMGRGILTTTYARLQEKKNYEDILEIYKDYYGGESFVRIYEKGKFPETKNVRYSNFCDIGIGLQEDVFISAVAVDNLTKGAAGQAVQNMNIMFDFPEDEGLKSPGMYP
ncbi:MAG TPA: N-acetyl-gamma-glutamyl-phosphate reductase [Thermodesulfobacteriota bacterium]|nr:N-acetyl-gamma-glutamyl-phosphate reductase [Thermodesulfobacteriota bacterium]